MLYLHLNITLKLLLNTLCLRTMKTQQFSFQPSDCHGSSSAVPPCWSGNNDVQPLSSDCGLFWIWSICLLVPNVLHFLPAVISAPPHLPHALSIFLDVTYMLIPFLPLRHFIDTSAWPRYAIIRYWNPNSRICGCIMTLPGFKSNAGFTTASSHYLQSLPGATSYRYHYFPTSESQGEKQGEVLLLKTQS